MSDDTVDHGKRRFLTLVTAGVGAVGAGFAATPFVWSMSPSDRAKAAGAPVEVDIGDLRPGRMLKVEWQGKPVWVLRRTEAMLASLPRVAPRLVDPNSAHSEQPEYVDREYRSIQSEFLVLVGLCTHLGCSPTAKIEPGPASGMGEDWQGGFFCPCHGSIFDLAGRVYKDMPAPTNLVVPPYFFTDERTLLVGVDQDRPDEVA